MADGTIAVADYKQGILSLDPGSGTITPIVSRYRSERLKGPNDLIVARNGDIYFTDQGQTGLHDPTGRVFRLRANGQMDCILSNGPSPNGLVLTPDEKFLFVAMTRDNSVWRLPVLPDGTTMKVGRFSQYFGTIGPDGMAVDSESNVFVAHASLGSIFVHNRYGELIARIASCRGRMVTNLAFGGPDRKTIFITESETGSVLAADWPIPG
jgi:gluconolactonase